MIRDILKAEHAANRASEDLLDARIIRQKGNYPGYAGYRQRGRAEARIAKRRRKRANRRLDQLLCQRDLEQ